MSFAFFTRRRLLPALVVLFIPLAWAEPRVVVSIAPLHSLAARVTEGVTEPALIYRSSQTPHGTGLSPDQLKTMMDADLLVWVGPELETGLGRLVARLSDAAVDYRWHDYEAGMTVHPMRDSLFEPAGAEAAHGHDHAHDHDGLDPHFWLDPANARVFVNQLAGRLAELDPSHAERYRANAEATATRLNELDERLRQRLADVGDAAFVVFHDGFQYFDRAYDLNALGALVLNPEVPPGPRTVARLAERAGEYEGVCLFHEPQYSDRWLAPLADAVPGARIAEIDPLGATHRPGPDLYPAVLTELGERLAHCLERL